MASKGKDVLTMKETQIKPRKCIPRHGRKLKSLPSQVLGMWGSRSACTVLAGGTLGRPPGKAGQTCDLGSQLCNVAQQHTLSSPGN